MKSAILFPLKKYQMDTKTGSFAFDFLRHFHAVSRIVSVEIDGPEDNEQVLILSRDFRISIEKCGDEGMRMECEAQDRSVLKSVERMAAMIANTVYDISPQIEAWEDGLRP